MATPKVGDIVRITPKVSAVVPEYETVIHGKVDSLDTHVQVRALHADTVNSYPNTLWNFEVVEPAEDPTVKMLNELPVGAIVTKKDWNPLVKTYGDGWVEVYRSGLVSHQCDVEDVADMINAYGYKVVFDGSE